MAQIILDTGPLVALLVADEKHHAWTQDRIRELQDPMLTCDAVLTETCFLLQNHSAAIRALRSYLARKLILSRFSTDSMTDRLFDLMETYRNVPMSFADACLVCLVEENPGATVFTLDRDFTIYRQHRRRVIPLIAPF